MSQLYEVKFAPLSHDPPQRAYFTYGGTGVTQRILFKDPGVCVCCGKRIEQHEEGTPASVEGYSGGQIFINFRRCKICSEFNALYLKAGNYAGLGIVFIVWSPLMLLIVPHLVTLRPVFAWLLGSICFITSMLSGLYLFRIRRRRVRKIAGMHPLKCTTCNANDSTLVSFINNTESMLAFRCVNRQFAEALGGINNGQIRIVEKK